MICGNRELYQLYLVGLMEKIDKTYRSNFINWNSFSNRLKCSIISGSNEEEQLNKKLGILLNINGCRKEKEYEDSSLNI